MAYRGTIVEESLADLSVLDEASIIDTSVEPTTTEDRTPWLEQWTIHVIHVPEENVAAFAEHVSNALEAEHPWYADFKNATTHYIIFKNKIFTIDRQNAAAYEEVKAYGVALGIHPYQLDFSPGISI